VDSKAGPRSIVAYATIRSNQGGTDKETNLKGVLSGVYTHSESSGEPPLGIDALCPTSDSQSRVYYTTSLGTLLPRPDKGS